MSSEETTEQFFINISRRITHFLTTNNYRIDERIDDSGIVITLKKQINSGREIDVGSINGSIIKEQKVSGTNLLRSEQFIEVDALSISYIEINPVFQGRGFSYLLLLLFIAKIYLNYPELMYLVLDDMSDNAGSIDNNLYAKFGFVPTDVVVPDNYLKNYYSFPEKQSTFKYIYDNKNSVRKKLLEYEGKILELNIIPNPEIIPNIKKRTSEEPDLKKKGGKKNKTKRRNKTNKRKKNKSNKKS
jgi:hypothetical protein